MFEEVGHSVPGVAGRGNHLERQVLPGEFRLLVEVAVGREVASGALRDLLPVVVEAFLPPAVPVVTSAFEELAGACMCDDLVCAGSSSRLDDVAASMGEQEGVRVLFAEVDGQLLSSARNSDFIDGGFPNRDEVWKVLCCGLDGKQEQGGEWDPTGFHESYSSGKVRVRDSPVARSRTSGKARGRMITSMRRLALSR